MLPLLSAGFPELHDQLQRTRRVQVRRYHWAVALPRRLLDDYLSAHGDDRETLRMLCDMASMYKNSSY
jgi:hypothetical protein